MKQFLILFALLVFSCKEKEPPPITIAGTYTLTSLVPSMALDPEGDGTYGDFQLIDNLTCPSKLIVSENDEVTFQNVNLSQYPGNPMTCSGFSYSCMHNVSGNRLYLDCIDRDRVYDMISNSELRYTFIENLVVEENGTAVDKDVTLIYTFTRD